MAFNLKTYEGQAKASVILAVISLLCSITAAVGILQRFSFEQFEIILKSKRFAMIMAVIGVAVIAGAIGFFMGLSGAGEKRNKASQLSWMGFFLNAGVITLALSLLAFFYLTKTVIS